MVQAIVTLPCYFGGDRGTHKNGIIPTFATNLHDESQ